VPKELKANVKAALKKK